MLRKAIEFQLHVLASRLLESKTLTATSEAADAQLRLASAVALS